MTITKYTFFSLHGNDFPVTSNSDGQLYQMLTGMKDGDYRIKDSTPPLNTALNRVYTNTSMVVGGRYFELKDHSINLKPAQTNFIHAVINIANVDDPVTITVEDANNSNTADINNTSNVLKVCFEIVVTSGSAITSVSRTSQITNIDVLNVTGELVKKTKTVAIYNGGGQIILTRIGPMVQADIRSMPAIPSNTTISGVIPNGYKPAADYTSLTHSNNRLIFYANGSIKPDNNAMVSDNGYYSCSWVTKDATPTT